MAAEPVTSADLHQLADEFAAERDRLASEARRMERLATLTRAQASALYRREVRAS
jgi:hypothetical protein